MRNSYRSWPLCLVFLLAFWIPLLWSCPAAHALRCGSKLVSVGDRKIDVLNKCGKPELIEEWKEEKIVYKITIDTKRFDKRERIDNAGAKYIEEWTYNFGANRFLHFLTFENNKLTGIANGSYGYDGPIPNDSDRTRCGKMLAIGDRKVDVLMKCGEPALKDIRRDERISTLEDKELGFLEENKLQVITDEWSYNFGPSHMLLFIEFENGRVVKFNQGGYGY